jgi:hypothetical protein
LRSPRALPPSEGRSRLNAGGGSGGETCMDLTLNDWFRNNFLGFVQVLTALALAYLTYELFRATSRYADQVEAQTGIMTRNKDLSERTLEFEEKKRLQERLIKEMDRLIGPLHASSVKTGMHRIRLLNFLRPIFAGKARAQRGSISTNSSF